MAKKKTAKQKAGIKRRPSAKQSRELSVISHLKLQAVRLIESSSKLVLRDGKHPTEHSVTIGVGHAIIQDEGTNTINIAVRVVVDARPPGKETDASRMTIMALVECIYTSATALSNEEAAGMVGMGALAAWPHVRDFVSSLTMRMGQPPLVLPLLILNPETKALTLARGNDSVSEAAPSRTRSRK
ncbi:MAG: hypothetical protein AABP62_29650 [Planctomycetota bacterium]